MTPTSIQNQISFAFSLAAGILILLDGAMMMWMGATMMSCCQGMGMMQSMMMSGTGLAMMAGFFILSIISGVIVLACGLMLNRNLEKRRVFGITIIVFSAISILGMGGFLIGAILGIVGGALVLAETKRVTNAA